MRNAQRGLALISPGLCLFLLFCPAGSPPPPAMRVCALPFTVEMGGFLRGLSRADPCQGADGEKKCQIM